jgi:hypothetical protein
MMTSSPRNRFSTKLSNISVISRYLCDIGKETVRALWLVAEIDHNWSIRFGRSTTHNAASLLLFTLPSHSPPGIPVSFYLFYIGLSIPSHIACYSSLSVFLFLRSRQEGFSPQAFNQHQYRSKFTVIRGYCA